MTEPASPGPDDDTGAARTSGRSDEIGEPEFAEVPARLPPSEDATTSSPDKAANRDPSRDGAPPTAPRPSGEGYSAAPATDTVHMRSMAPDRIGPVARRLTRERRRLERQFSWVRRSYPRAGFLVERLSRPGWALVRVPAGLLFMIGGLLAILPVFGLWMIPLGLLLLAVDVPRLRRPVAAAVIRLRRRAERFRAKRRKT